MSRTFYTERDIEDLAKNGIREVQVDDSVYITDLAREKMELLGVKVKQALKSSAPAVGVKQVASHAGPTPKTSGPLADADRQKVIEQVKSGVIARLGAEVDPMLLDTLVRRIVNQL